MVIEAGVAAGYVIAWVLRKAGRVAGGVDAEADAAIDAGLERLHAVVTTKLSGHPVLVDLTEEAASDEEKVSELTRQQVELAVTAAARKDEEFARAVSELVAQVRAAEQANNRSVAVDVKAAVFAGDAHAEADHGGVAFGQVAGDVRVNRVGTNEQKDPS